MKLPVITWIYTPSGNCPVQAEGYFMGYWFYFRARGEQATITFCYTDQDLWEDNKFKACYVLANTETYAAGWLPKWKCRLLIWKGCLKFLYNSII